MAQKQWARKKTTMSVLSYHKNRQIIDDSQFTNQFLSRRFASSEGLFRKNLTGHFGCINAIEFSNKGGNFLASGGDDRRIVLWNMQDAISTGNAWSGRPQSSRNSKSHKMKTVSLRGEHHSNIFSLAFDSQNKNIFSGGNDAQVLVHDMQTGETIDVFLHEDAVFGVVVDPCNDNVFASAGDDGRVLIWDIREPSHHEPFVLANYATSFHAVVYHPVESRFLATANCKEGLALWDVRKPRTCLLRYGGVSQQSAMSVCFDNLGRRILGLRRRLPPVLYDLHNSVPTYQFDHSGYYNSCTMKTGCFAGDKHQYVVSGSDDFNLYVWQVPEGPVEEGWVGEAHMVLQGHRSIVNQVCFNNDTHMIASSGVEKVIKLWSPFALPESRGNVRGDQDLWEVDRPMYNRGEYLNLMMNSSSALSYDYSNQSMEEDPRMIAFFDSLVQREVDGGFSDSSDSDVTTDQMLLSVSDFRLIDFATQSDSDSLSPDTTIILQLDRQQESTIGQSDGRHQKVSTSGETQEPSNIDSLTPSGSDHSTKRAAVDSSNSSSDLTDTDEEGRRLFESYCAKQRELDRKNRRRKKMKLTNQQIDSNKLVSLRQRLACKKALKHKMHKKSTKSSAVKIVIGSVSSDEEEETARANILPVQNALTSRQNSVRSLRRRIACVDNQDTIDLQEVAASDYNTNNGNKVDNSSSDLEGKQQSTSGVNRGSDSEDQPSCSWKVSHHGKKTTQNQQAQLAFDDENKDSDNEAQDRQEFKPKQKKCKRQYRSNKRE